MAIQLVFMMCPVGIALALLRRAARAVPAGPAAHRDVPERLLRWAAGLLSAQREEWGQAMLGELDHIDGQGPRWRFSAGCAGAALLLPPWGPAAAAVWAMTVAAAGAAGVYAAVAVRYRLGGGDWVFAVITLVFLAGFTLAAATLLRRPGVALPGLLGGLVVALAWLAMQGFTFYDVIAPWTAPFWPLVPMIAVPAGVGVAGTLRAGSAAASGAPPGWPPSAPAWACTCTGPSRSRCSAPAGRHRIRAPPSATPSATGSAVTRSQTWCLSRW